MKVAGENTVIVLGSLKEQGVFKLLQAPPGQSLEFDEGPGATRTWLRPHLGHGNWHLVAFVDGDALETLVPFIQIPKLL